MSYPNSASRSARLFERAKAIIPGGNTRLAIFQSPYPLYMQSGEGCYITDVDGVTRIDCVNNMTSLIHGHRPPAVMAAVRRQIESLLTVAAPTESEIELAEVLCARLAGVEQVRYCNSGTEAVMFGIRAARAFTGRAKVAKVEGAYHGSYDPMATGTSVKPSNWGDPREPATVPDGKGISPAAVSEVVTLPFNNVNATLALLEKHARDLAAVVLDLMPARLRYACATHDYVAMIRECCDRLGILLILDEVISFRLGYNGAQAEWQVVPDLTAMGKVIGGGFPIGVLGGRREVMAVFDQLHGPDFVMHGGTFNANPVSMTAGIATLAAWTRPEVERLDALGARFREGMEEVLRASRVPGAVGGKGSLCFAGLGAAGGPIRSFRDLIDRGFNAKMHTAFRIGMLNAGVFVLEGGAFVLSTPMDDSVIDEILEKAQFCLRDLSQHAA